MEKMPNSLIDEKSPYLLQHAYNPVNWYPWSEKAFKKAGEENKPVFLSIGYSTCHWCHVMEKESFEDDKVANLMNQAFISIKVDREERPDIDNIYMTVCQMLTGGGGWPLTIIMTPDKKPFFAGTYIPKKSRFGRVGMVELIPMIQELWSSRYDEVIKASDNIIEALHGTDDFKPEINMDLPVLEKAYRELAGRFDKECGGFGKAPKFPAPHNLLFLLRYWKRTEDKKALHMVEKTLFEMRQGGVFDHIGSGFHRYSTDRKWLLPHFEKMLYDQAMIAIAYLETYQATSKSFYRETAREIFEYVLRDMTSSQGGFYSAEDADSEGQEGKFYVWNEEDILQLLGKEKTELISRVFNIQKNGNYLDEATGEKCGTNILHIRGELSETAADLKIPLAELERELTKAKNILFKNRKDRIHPQKDDKILTDWNGLMIAALSRGARICEDDIYLDAAQRAADFILKRLRNSHGRLLHRYREGEAAIHAHLDDYAFMVWGLIELYEASFNARYLKKAIELNQEMLSLFWDEKNGGLYFSPYDSEELIVRKKEIYDGAIPSGNSVAMLNMLRLASFTGFTDLEEKADKLARFFSGNVQEMPSAHTFLMCALDFALGTPYKIVIAGDLESADTKEMIKALHSTFIPNKVSMLITNKQDATNIKELDEDNKNYVSINDQATAYVCITGSCESPTTDIDIMMGLLDKKQVLTQTIVS